MPKPQKRMPPQHKEIKYSINGVTPTVTIKKTKFDSSSDDEGSKDDFQ